MSFESCSLIVWRFELLGLYQRFVADADGGGGFMGIECTVVDGCG